jgi:hypothetical protein
MQNAIIHRSVLAEARITATPAIGQRFFFDDIPDISKNNIVVYGIIGYSATQLATSPQQRPVIAAAGVPSIALTIVDANNVQLVQQMPIYDSVRSLNGGFVATFDNLPMNLTRSYIEIMATTSLNSGDSWVCELLYRYK